MNPNRRGKQINGWLIIDKEAGISSNAVAVRVRKITKALKIGHCGTLDPLATGVLPLALGEATKAIPFAIDGMKTYCFQIRWGEARTTDDAEGEVIETSEVRPGKAEILAMLSAFTGGIEQIPPQFSAVKINGERAYRLARAGQKVEIKARRVHIEKFELAGLPDKDHGDFRVVSGKGAYMRSLARDLAARLGTAGHISMLRRTKVGPFTEQAAISLDNLEALGHSSRLQDVLLPIETALDGIPALDLTEAEGGSLRRGQPIAALPVASRAPLKCAGADAAGLAMAGGRPVAIVKIERGEIRPLRVFNL